MARMPIWVKPLAAVLPAAVAFCLATAAHAQVAPETQSPVQDLEQSDVSEGALSAAGSLTLASKYLFQGIDYSEGHAVLQPNATLTLQSFSLDFWGNFQTDITIFNEIDFSLNYDHAFGRLALTTGYSNLHYPNRVDWDPSQELFADLAMEAPLSPTLSAHYDFDAGSGAYLTLGMSHPATPSLSFGVNLFIQSGYYDQTGVPGVELNSTWERSIGPVTVSPSISYIATWDNGSFRDEAAVPSTWFFSMTVSPSF